MGRNPVNTREIYLVGGPAAGTAVAVPRDFGNHYYVPVMKPFVERMSDHPFPEVVPYEKHVYVDMGGNEFHWKGIR